MSETFPILYSFRRCPYAIRARLAIKVCSIQVELREVKLADKPMQMLECSPKGTVPVLHLLDNTVIDESLEIMKWALSKHDPHNWLLADFKKSEETNRLISFNDNEFKQCLDHYKYADRFPEHSKTYYREQAEVFLKMLEENLNQARFLVSDHITLADMAIFPFIRQFVLVDKDWFEYSEYKKIHIWLNNLLDMAIFKEVMNKYPPWHPGNAIQLFNAI
ncbi:MAG: glutathione S-transferase [Gammaproteobacteria bacterium]|nr:glutathione S-transferase [Gammaproteobacteria bacterium]MCW8987391.1 glutathione S-transferase [Gammaproteobacteria bacterium]MCW9030262.1 glutathione S-transferase [Gammaproteobacteria bacterium]